MGTRIRIPAATTFAIEMVRAALPLTDSPHRLNGTWTHMDMQMGDEEHRVIALGIAIFGVVPQVSARCSAYKREGVWQTGRCTISIGDDPRRWTFDCEVKDGAMVATPLATESTPQPRPADASR